MYLNKAIVIGNITKDPELRALPAGTKVCSFTVATNRTWKEKDGTKKEASEFHNIVVFGNQAEATAQYMRKGSQIMVEGRIQTRSWDNKEGGKNYRTEIVAENIQFGNNKPTNEARTTLEYRSEEIEKRQGAVPTSVEYPESDSPEDIPF